MGNDEIVRNSSKLSNLNIWKDSDATRNERSEMALALSGMGVGELVKDNCFGTWV